MKGTTGTLLKNQQAFQISGTSGLMTKVSVAGATGYVGQELLRLLLQHPQVEIVSVGSNSNEGCSFAELSPHTKKQFDQICKSNDLGELSNDCDVLFMALPHGTAAEKLTSKIVETTKVIDLSGDFRLTSAHASQQWYGYAPVDATLVGKAVYGLPELNRKQISEASFIANPGCYATAAALALAPLAKAGMIVENSIILDGKSGVSGAGKSLSLSLQFSEVNESIKAYQLPQHKHCAEIEQTLQQIGGPNSTEYVSTFSAHLVPMNRGILMTAYANLKSKEISIEDIDSVYKSAYEDEPFIRLSSPNSQTMPETRWVKGTNYCDIGYAIDQRSNKIVVVSVIDNLVKGAAGQAIQNMNLMLGYPETQGLQQVSYVPG